MDHLEISNSDELFIDGIEVKPYCSSDDKGCEWLLIIIVIIIIIILNVLVLVIFYCIKKQYVK